MSAQASIEVPRSIPMVDLAAQHALYAEEIERAVLDRLRGGDYVGAAAVEALEREFAEYVGAAAAVGCSSGTDAIELVLRAAGLEAGDEVIVPAFTFLATAEAVARAGLRPVVVDVTPETFLLDVARAQCAWGRRTVAVVPVWLYGSMACAEDVMREFDQAELFEDCAQAHGAFAMLDGGRRARAGSFGLAGAFSCYPTKNLSTVGNAGIATFARPLGAMQAKRIRNHGWTGTRHEVFGYNAKLDGLQADVLRVKLQHLDSEVARRREIARFYSAQLRGVVTPHLDIGHACNLYTVRVPGGRRDEVAAKLRDRGIATAVHYRETIDVSLQRARVDFRMPYGCPVAKRLCHEVLSLPIDPTLSDSDIMRVSDALNEVTR